MRISRPEKFDARKEYRVGERAIYKGDVIKCVQCSQELKRMGKRCCACVISAEDCPTLAFIVIRLAERIRKIHIG